MKESLQRGVAQSAVHLFVLWATWDFFERLALHLGLQWHGWFVAVCLIIWLSVCVVGLVVIAITDSLKSFWRTFTNSRSC